MNNTKQSRIVKLAQAAAKRKKEQRLVNRDGPPDVLRSSAGMIRNATDYLTASDKHED
ncbi:hypothetical protein SAMN04488128_101235 [Chitinophaga eiseniae]|uniref:Uncharacterized protein n=1 Tax=Chitinophaga eiseniae TaxID=634771 RepID=A0A1T4KP89_9BACT|nr:hypothetical protein [Chitinophaga eiseniae]SJZ44232.1 hypothetical protein SAMN04488128_101235 [Chitinophaga eiseniae]